MLTGKQAAAYLGISPYYLRNLRQDLSGPPTYEGRTSRNQMQYLYKEADLDEWSKTHKWRKRK